MRPVAKSLAWRDARELPVKGKVLGPGTRPDPFMKVRSKLTRQGWGSVPAPSLQNPLTCRPRPGIRWEGYRKPPAGVPTGRSESLTATSSPACPRRLDRLIPHGDNRSG